jgi:hypothetical protein
MRDGAADRFVSNDAPVTNCHPTNERGQKADLELAKGGRALGQRSKRKKALDMNRRFTEGILCASPLHAVVMSRGGNAIICLVYIPPALKIRQSSWEQYNPNVDF